MLQILNFLFVCSLILLLHAEKQGMPFSFIVFKQMLYEWLHRSR